ncbi:hypothetical protein D9756_010693 [Leucocoprinus leucothites]|uniref:Protein kinase domain-containing protein n=1 Tax=Leucocoprinus leucothites TaxID=201217 RepID=A0A8H5CUF5_9AGAR|nr:hypothetical protein D9756_010693 [Leucoagaricus leucothites]
MEEFIVCVLHPDPEHASKVGFSLNVRFQRHTLRSHVQHSQTREEFVDALWQIVTFAQSWNEIERRGGGGGERRGSSKRAAGGDRNAAALTTLHPTATRLLSRVAVRIDEGITEDEAWRLFGQTVDVLVHMSTLGILHRDIKLTNIFIDANGGCGVRDFGLATSSLAVVDLLDVTRHPIYPEAVNVEVGTRLYFAPRGTIEEEGTKKSLES